MRSVGKIGFFMKSAQKQSQVVHVGKHLDYSIKSIETRLVIDKLGHTRTPFRYNFQYFGSFLAIVLESISLAMRGEQRASSMWLSARSAAIIIMLGGPSTLKLINYKHAPVHVHR